MTTITIYSHYAAEPGWAAATGVANPTWTGQVADADLNAIFRAFNRVDDDDSARLVALGYRLPSLSVGDVITLPGDPPAHHLVAPFGFHEISDADYARLRGAADPRAAAERLAFTA